MSLVYKHIRLDKNEPFYIGISKNYKRAYDFYCRSKFWKSVYNKTDIKVEIIIDNISYKKAQELEKQLIQKYGRRDSGTGILVNMTDGGEGHLGMSEANKLKISKLRKGKPTTLGYKHNEKTKQRLSFLAKYRENPFKNKKHSDKSKRLISQGNSKEVLQYTKDDKFIKEWTSLSEAELTINGKLTGNISKCLAGKSKTSFGYKWKFKT